VLNDTFAALALMKAQHLLRSLMRSDDLVLDALDCSDVETGRNGHRRQLTSYHVPHLFSMAPGYWPLLTPCGPF
jgi:hypothetical protein